MYSYAIVACLSDIVFVDFQLIPVSWCRYGLLPPRCISSLIIQILCCRFLWVFNCIWCSKFPYFPLFFFFFYQNKNTLHICLPVVLPYTEYMVKTVLGMLSQLSSSRLLCYFLHHLITNKDHCLDCIRECLSALYIRFSEIG